MNKIEKIKIIKNEFAIYNYVLSEDDLSDLNIQLDRKHYLIYLKMIELLRDDDEKITYENVKSKIKQFKLISKEIMHFLIALDEGFRNQLYGDITNWSELVKKNKMDFYDVIIEEYKEDSKNIDAIRKCRNYFAHNNYFGFFNEINDLIESLNYIKKFDWVNNENIDKCIRKINNFLNK